MHINIEYYEINELPIFPSKLNKNTIAQTKEFKNEQVKLLSKNGRTNPLH